jgi:hypothetical protein
MTHPPESVGLRLQDFSHHHHLYLSQHLTNCCSILQVIVILMAMVQPMSMVWVYSIYW